jgi:hypothetical protein
MSRAEQWILGILLMEPGRWMKVQRAVHVEDFADPLNRRLAELYWEHQRHEGEPVFNEFLGELGSSDPALVERAVEAVAEMETLAGVEGEAGSEDRPDHDHTLREAIAHIERARTVREEQKLLAELRRTSLDRRADPQGKDQSREADSDNVKTSSGDDLEISLLKQVQDKARRPDLRRV